MEEFSLSNTQYGFITSGFLLAYAVGQLFSGPVIDRLGTKPSFSWATGLWSIAGILHATCQGFLSLFSARVLLGLFEGANFPAGLKAIAEWFPARDRSMAVGILAVGPGLGAIIAPPLFAFITYYLGWRWSFIIAGLIGFIWIAIWRWAYDAPESHKRLSSHEYQLIVANRINDGASDRISWRAAIRDQKVLGLMLSRFVADGAFYFFIFWLPTYLAQERGFNILEIGLTAWIPFLAADLGSLAGGWVSSQLLRRGFSLNFTRNAVIWIGSMMVLAGIPAIFVNSAIMAIALISTAMFAIQFKAAAFFALPADLYPKSQVATIWGMFGAAGSIGGMVFGAAIGWMVDSWSYMPVFICAGLMHIVSALIINMFIPRIEPVTAT
jgi:ACS family hexuronate transporter-like MFS transporter